MAKQGGHQGINWAGARDSYVTREQGYESFSKVAKTLGVTTSAVEKHASDREQNGGRTWGEWREEFDAELSGQKTEIVKTIKVKAAAATAMQHAEILAELTAEAKDAIKNALSECEPKDRVKLALAIIAMERRVHGLDRAPVQLEVTGKDGKPIEHDVALFDDIDDATRAIAERALEALFGETPNKG